MIEILVSIIFLVASAEILVRTASALALQLGVSPMFVGLTVVGFGTSSPELASSLSATIRGIPDIGIGNIVGSNIFNIGMILGLTAILRPIPISYSRLKIDLKVALAACFVPILAFVLGTQIEKVIGTLALVSLAGYIRFAYLRDSATELVSEAQVRNDVEKSLFLSPSVQATAKQVTIQLMVIIVSLVILVLSASRFVESATEIARSIGVSERVIGLTIVAAGTSFPELVTCLAAARRNCPEIAVGNVIGSNIFNILGIFGICSVVGPQALQATTLYTDIPVMMLFTLALFPAILTGSVISRKEGVGLVCGYSAYGALLIYTLGP